MEVEPVRKKKQVKKIYRWLKENYTVREAELWLIGCNVALRCGDLLSLRFDQIDGKTHIEIHEQKTSKHKKFPITPIVRESVERLREYYASKEWFVTKKFESVYLFQGTSHRNYHHLKPCTIQWVSEVFKKCQRELPLPFNFNTHSMRKTFGYRAYKNGEDIHHLQALFNHSHSKVTLRYIGVTKREIEKMYFKNSMDIAS